jgi:hypothetical protein
MVFHFGRHASNFTNAFLVNAYSSNLLSSEKVDEIAAAVNTGAPYEAHIITATSKAMKSISISGTNQVLNIISAADIYATVLINRMNRLCF